MNKKATLTNNNTVAIVTGSVVCAAPEPLSVTAAVVQNHAGTNVTGQGTESGLICTGLPQTFAVQVPVLTPPNATYSKGPASAIVNANTALGSETVTADIQLTE